MSDMSVIKIHEGEGPEFVMVASEVDCLSLYQTLADRFGISKVLIDLSNLPNPIEIVESQAHANDVLFCLIAPGFYPVEQQDVRQWLTSRAYDHRIVRHVGNIYVVINLDDLKSNEPELIGFDLASGVDQTAVSERGPDDG